MIRLIYDPDGTLVQKPGEAGCIGSESSRSWVNPFGVLDATGIRVSADGKRIYVFEYICVSGGSIFFRHPSGRPTRGPGL
jgi:hypothetical protein